MRKPHLLEVFSGFTLFVWALFCPLVAFAAPQAAQTASPAQSAAKSAWASVAQSATKSAPAGSHHRAVLFGKGNKKNPQAMKVTPQGSGTPALTPPDWYVDDASNQFEPEIPKGIVGATGTPFPVIITNTSAATTVIVSSITGDNPDFTFGGTCTAEAGIAPGATCVLEITYNPETSCQVSSVDVTFTDNDPGGNLALIFGSYGATSGGLTTDDLRDTNLSATQLAQSLVGPGVTISNVTYTGSPWALGNFSGGAPILGFDKGIVLSNGAVPNVIGPNCSTGITQSNATPGDTDLSNLIGQVTNDAAVLEFDFVPSNPTISFQYVWSSDEYQDFVFDYNDVFGFFLGQPGNSTDIALIPGTNTIVSINNVNNGSTDPLNANIPPVNPQFYVNNDFQAPAVAPFNTEMDGMTVVLTATATVTPGQTNHIKLAVADAIDTLFDSNVFIRAGSLVSSAVSSSPTALAFGNINIGNTTPSQTVTITNVGAAPLTSVAVTTSVSNFAQTNNCPATLAAGASCNITVTFSSATAGLVQGNIQISDNAPDSPQLISLSGTAISGPFVTFSPTSLTFGPQAQGTVSPAQTLTLTNTGTAALNINQVTFLTNENDESSEFTFVNNCPDAPIAPKASCTISVSYAPDTSSEPPDLDALIVIDNAQNQGSQSVGLSGGVSVSAVVTPANLAFGNQAINTTSASQAITISNPATNTGSLTIASVVVSAGFAETNTCVAAQTLLPGTTCTISVSFSPTAVQSYTGTVVITDSAVGSPQIVPITGTGTGAAQVITISPTSFNFGSQAVGSSGSPETFTVTNPGPAAVTVSGISASANWQLPAPNTDGACSIESTNLLSGSSCTIAVVFSPSAAGALTGTLTVPYTVTGGAAGKSVTAALSGTGTTPTGTVTVSPTTLNFASQVVNTTSPAQAVTITNTGTTSVNITGVAAPAGFAQTNNCETLAASATCTVNVTFTPTAATGYEGDLVITDSAQGGSQSVSLSGFGVNSPVIITIAPGGSNTATTVPGGTAYYGLIITAVPGFSGTVQLGCLTSSPQITCTPVPSSITLSASGTTEVAFAIQTYCQGNPVSNPGFVPVFPGGKFGGPLALLLVTFSLGGCVWTFQRKPRIAVALALVLIIVLGGAACGSLPKGPNGITPAGTYTLTLTTTTNGQVVTLPAFLKLVVN